MKCILHIGTEKTGTVTLQNFFNDNRVILAQSGYYYPSTLGPVENRKLPVCAYMPSRRDNFTKANNITSNEELKKLQDTIISELKSELQNTKQEYVIFSSEHLHSRLGVKDEILRLKKILNELGFDDIKVLVYLREQADLTNSLYSTQIRSGSHSSSPEYTPNNWRLNYKFTLSKWASVFGFKNIIPRIFDREELKNGSIIYDFLENTGIEWNADFSVRKDANKSISKSGLEILRRVNKLVPPHLKRRPNDLRGDILKYFNNSDFAGGRYTMPRQLFEKIRISFAKSNEVVRQTWFPERSRLFRKKSIPKETKSPIPKRELDRIGNLISQIWVTKQQTINELKQEIKILKSNQVRK